MMTTKHPLSSILFPFFAIALFACATETTSSSAPETGTVRQAQTASNEEDDRYDNPTQCRNDCVDHGMIPCANACPPGPGASACIEKCVDEEESCRKSCDEPKKARTADVPTDSIDELSPDANVKPPAAKTDYSFDFGKLKP